MDKLSILTAGSVIFLGLLLPSTSTFAKQAKQARPPGYENKDFRISLTARTSSQTIAFYTGRGFPIAALDELKAVCFITIGIKNKGTSRVWFDLDNWRFSIPEGVVKRRTRNEWAQRWDKIGLEKRFQSTFRWTLMPEKMGLYPYEGEGGNVTLIKTDKAMTLTGRISVGKDKSTVYPIKIKNIHCASEK